MYIDLNTLRVEGGFRVATFLTIFATAAANAHNIKLDRITQETAFNCAKHSFSFLSTTGYLAGKAVAGRTDKGDWRQQFREIPPDPISKRSFELACKSPLAVQPATAQPAMDSPGTVDLPGPSATTPESDPRNP
jgi:hypothetical protein